MFDDEILPQCAVGAAEVILEMDAVVLTIAQLAEDFLEGLDVARLAVHDHTVHIKNDRTKRFYHTSRRQEPSERAQSLASVPWAGNGEFVTNGWRAGMELKWLKELHG